MRLYNAAAREREPLVYPPTIQLDNALLPRTRAELACLTGNYRFPAQFTLLSY